MLTHLWEVFESFVNIFLFLYHLPPVQETQARSLGREDPLEKEMATHSSTLAWRISWTEELGRLQSTGSQRVRHDWVTSLSLSLSFHGFRLYNLWKQFIWGSHVNMAQQLLIGQSMEGIGLSETHTDGQSLKRSCLKGPCPTWVGLLKV